jgi:hypothetical protein
MRNLILVSCLIAGGLFPDPAAAHRRWGSTRARPLPFETYAAFKAGGYDADAQWSGDGGLFLGFEWGISPIPPVDFGFGLDWVHRTAGGDAILVTERPLPFPAEWEVTTGVSSDLIPMGPVLRARFPIADSRIVPFIAGHLTYDVLRVEWTAIDEFNGELVTDGEWFHGLGAGAAIGVEAKMSPGFALLVEAGVHDSEPGRELLVNGIPLDVRVDAGGEFARAGVRVSF